MLVAVPTQPADRASVASETCRLHAEVTRVTGTWSEPDDGGDGVEAEVRLRWDGADTLGEILESLGETPIPPYFNRRATADDLHRCVPILAPGGEGG